MNTRYEALYILNPKGGDDVVKDTIDRIEADIKKEGATIEATQRIGRREFAYAAGPLSSGYYVNIIISGAPDTTDKLKKCFQYNEEVYRQHYFRLPLQKAKKGAPAA